MLKRLFLIFLFSAMLFRFPVKASAEELSEVLAEANTGTVLVSKAPDAVHSAGSLSKLMTVLIAAESIEAGTISMDTVLTADEHANSMQGAQIWLMPGDKITVEELMKAVIIGNANDAAALLASGIGGTEEKFVEMMNCRASELGMSGTLYVNASGYQSTGDRTTAADTAIILCELARHRELYELFGTRLEYVCGDSVQLVNSNPSVFRNKGGIGFKAGFTGEKESLRYYAAEGAERDGEMYVSAVLGFEDEEEAAERAAELLEHGFANYRTISPPIPEEIPSFIEVRGGRQKKLRTEVKNMGKIVIPVGTADKITYRTALSDYVYAPVKKGQTVGQVMFYYDEKHVFTADICTVRASEKSTVSYMLCKMYKKLLDF